MSIGEVGRTIRYADEVWTPNGIVDSIRFEDYIADKYEDCKRINFEHYLKAGDILLQNQSDEALPLGQCKLGGTKFPRKYCQGCFYRIKEVKRISMMITAFEVKITLADFKSKNGHNIDDVENPIGNENYYCVPSELYSKIKTFVPEHVGVLTYNGNGLRCVMKSAWVDVDDKTKIVLLYNAMKKWCDGKQ